MLSILYKLARWFDNNGLLFFAGLLVLLIPLYPKVPIFSPIEQYIVRVRLEDFVVAIAVVFTFVQILRKKARVDKITLAFMASYAIAGLLSILSAVFITQTVPLQPLHVAKTALHFFRYMEYFSVFFVSFAAIQTKKDVRLLLKLLVLSVFAIAVYGYMQKFFYWPVYSTMNREFSKGIRLVLTEHARIQSTFAGHYDMAAYLVIVLPIILSLALIVRSKKKKSALLLVFFSGFWLMVMSASRIPFAAIIFGLLIVLLLHALLRTKILEKLTFMFSRTIFFSIFLTLMLYYFGQNMLDRISNAISSADKNPTPTVPTNRPRDVYEDIPEPVDTTVTLADGSVQRTVIHKTRVYSDCALQHELSLCIRLESLWPWAVQSFITNPVFGTGYATLNKQFVDEFTIADSTDNNHKRKKAHVRH